MILFNMYPTTTLKLNLNGQTVFNSTTARCVNYSILRRLQLLVHAYSVPQLQRKSIYFLGVSNKKIKLR